MSQMISDVGRSVYIIICWFGSGAPGIGLSTSPQEMRGSFFIASVPTSNLSEKVYTRLALLVDCVVYLQMISSGMKP